jgi:hypothetical protein
MFCCNLPCSPASVHVDFVLNLHILFNPGILTDTHMYTPILNDAWFVYMYSHMYTPILNDAWFVYMYLRHCIGSHLIIAIFIFSLRLLRMPYYSQVINSWKKLPSRNLMSAPLCINCIKFLSGQSSYDFYVFRTSFAISTNHVLVCTIWSICGILIMFLI